MTPRTLAAALPCPTPGKITFASRGEANAALRRFKKDGFGNGMIPYRCRCGAFHLGHDRPVQKRPRRDHRRMMREAVQS